MAGIGGRPKGGPAVTERAPLVIGADGKHSMVAAAVGAPSYRARPPLSMGFYTYWADAPVSGGELYGRPGCALGAWPTNDGLVMTYLAWPAARFDEFRRDVEGNFLRTLDDVGLGERIRPAAAPSARYRSVSSWRHVRWCAWSACAGSPSWCSGRRAAGGQLPAKPSWSLPDLRPSGQAGGPVARAVAR